MTNLVILIGNLGRDPETRYSGDGNAYTTIALATKESWKDKSGQRQEKTEWHDVVFNGRLAEIASEYLKKGSHVYIEGSISTSKYEKDGQTQYRTRIRARNMQMLGGKGNNGGGQRDDSGNYQMPGGNYQRPGQIPAANRSPHNPQGQAEPADDFDDDIPF